LEASAGDERPQDGQALAYRLLRLLLRRRHGGGAGRRAADALLLLLLLPPGLLLPGAALEALGRDVGGRKEA
jgi:hypothetical protein